MSSLAANDVIVTESEAEAIKEKDLFWSVGPGNFYLCSYCHGKHMDDACPNCGAASNTAYELIGHLGGCNYYV